MALPTSGTLTLLDIQNEFGGSNPIGLNEYYGAAAGIPTSGVISINNFYGAAAYQIVVPNISSENWTSNLTQQAWNGLSAIAGSDNASAAVTLNFNPAVNLSVGVTVTSEINFDFGSYSINNIQQWRESGEQSSYVTFNNVNTFTATYIKDYSVHNGGDYVYVSLSWTTA